MFLENQIAIVTGAGRGIGKAVSIKLAENGATVILAGRTRKNLENVKKEITEKGHKAECYVIDVSLDEKVEKMSEFIKNKYGKLDILVNNAGITHDKKFLEMTMYDWDLVMNTNLRSVALVTGKLLPLMLGQGKGKIVNMASGAGIRGLPGSCAYSASKAGVICLTQALADEIKASGIRCNVICPGPVDTELFKESKQREFILSSGGFIFEPDTVADGVLYLVSDMSKGINSQILSIRGSNRW